MNAPLKVAPEAPEAAAKAYTIVVQVKSNRVVYFTDDPEYQPPMEGDWYYVGSFAGAPPDGMTLRNCWGWRFTGDAFTDAREPQAKPRRETLLDHNRRALLRILKEKIDAVREPYAPDCSLGDNVRRTKLAEAQAYLAEPEASAAYSLLEAAAVARNLPLAKAAALIVKRAQQTREILVATERVREQFTAAIASAPDEAALLQVRAGLLDKAYPDLTRRFAFLAVDTEPQDLEALLPDAHRVHEIARLKVQLRERINAKRESIDSQYVQNDTALKHKVKLAQLLVAQGGERPAGVDFAMLDAYAGARDLAPLEAAKLIVASMADAGRVLTETENLKDRLLAQIDAIKSLGEIRRVSSEIEKLEVKAP